MKQETCRSVFSRLPADVHEVIVVDGHSVDDTLASIFRLPVMLA